MPRRPACLASIVLVAWAFGAGAGCVAHYKDRTGPVRAAYESGESDAALSLLEEAAEARRLDALLLHLDRGMILHAAGRYAESIEALAEAERLSEARETVYLRDEAGRHKLYRTSEYEKQLINVVQALNFAALGDHEGALVEVRRIDGRLRVLVAEGRPYWDRLAIARYVGGVLHEQAGERDGAFIDYAAAHRIEPNPALGEPLVRLARALGRADDERRMTASYPAATGEGLAEGEGEVVVVIAAGRSPERRLETREIGPPEDRSTIQYMAYVPRPWAGEPASVAAGETAAEAETITSLESLVSQRGPLAWVEDTERRGTYMASWGHLLLFCLCPPVGMVTTTIHAVDKGILAAQTWLSLPAEYQVARLRLPAGTHAITVTLGDETWQGEAAVSAGAITVLPVRVYGVE